VGYCRKRRFMAILDQHCAVENTKLAGDSECIKSEYDFLYLPIDFQYGSSSFPHPESSLSIQSNATFH
jgi:hypothetical protein